MIRLENEHELRDIFEHRNCERPFCLVIGGEWCPNCKNLMAILENAKSEISENVDVYGYEMTTQDQQNDKSFVMTELGDITGEPVMSLPYVLYSKAGLNDMKVGGMTMQNIIVKKINALAESSKPGNEDSAMNKDRGHLKSVQLYDDMAFANSSNNDNTASSEPDDTSDGFECKSCHV